VLIHVLNLLAFLYARLVDGAGGIKLTKDGKVLLSEMVIT
jgi:hypothetical protein